MKYLLSLLSKVLVSQINYKDFLCVIIFFSFPLAFFATDFETKFQLIYYGIVMGAIILYALFTQFFRENEKVSMLGRNLISLACVNTVVLSFIHFTGNAASNFFFMIYLLLFSMTPFYGFAIVIIEDIIVLLVTTLGSIYNYGSLYIFFKSADTLQKVNIFSILLLLPLLVAISTYIKNLKSRSSTLNLSKELLSLEEVEDEMLLSEISQGIIMLDSELKIVKMSKWIETNLEINPLVWIDRKFSELSLYDYVTNLKLSETDYFYQNLTSDHPRKINWRVLYKDEYGKLKKLTVKQVPLVIEDRKIGFLLSIKYPQTALEQTLSSFNRLLNFRISSSLSMIRNLIASFKGDVSSSSLVTKQLDLLALILRDMNIRDEMVNGEYEITVEQVNVLDLLSATLSRLQKEGRVSLWNVNPIYKNTPLIESTDAKSLERIFVYSIRAALLLAKERELTISVEEESNTLSPEIVITANAKEEFLKPLNLEEPFFGGRLILLSRFSGTGLELSNAKLIAAYLDFDFSAEISNNKIIIRIIFQKHSHEK